VWRGKGALLLIPPVLAVFIWKLTEITEGAKGVINMITTEYNKWLYIPVLFSGSEASVYEITAFFAAAGVVLAFLLYGAICLKRDSLLVVFFTVPLVFLTFVINYLQPSIWFLIGLLAIYLTLLISNGLDKDVKPGKKRRGIFAAVVMTALLLGLAYFVSSPNDYRRGERLHTLESSLISLSERTQIIRLKSGVGWPAVSGDGAWRFNTDRVRIADAGIRTITDTPLLEVNATRAGSYYLRGYSMQYFDGRTWSVDSRPLLPDEDIAVAMPALIMAEYSRINNTDRAQVNMIVINKGIDETADKTVYTPYYSYPVSWSDLDIGLYNDYDVDFYYTRTSIIDVADMISGDSPILNSRLLAGYNKMVKEEFTMVDRSTAGELRRLALEAGIDTRADRAVIADKVASYISSSARYTLTPYVIPDDKDFALYFLQNSKQGYCIHFATAATLMLRALDVPARFTYGFAITVAQSDVGRSVEVTDRNAHAWVEVYYDDIGWLPLEVTPPASGVGPSDGRPAVSATVPPLAPVDNDRNDDTGALDDMPPDWVLGQLEQDVPTQPPGPGGGAGAQQDPTQEQDDQVPQGSGVVWTVVVSIVVFAAVVLSAIVVRRSVIRKRHNKSTAQEDPNAAVIHVWRYVTRLDRNMRLPAEMEALALKARFSNHRISGDEREDMIGRAFRFAEEVYAHKSVFGRLWLKWGVVI